MSANNNNNNNRLTKQKMQIYEVGFTMIIKLILVIAGLVAFFIILFHLINEKDNTTKIIYGCFDTLLGGSIYLVYRHYFPEKKE